jgi:hypothetical protein
MKAGGFAPRPVAERPRAWICSMIAAALLFFGLAPAHAEVSVRAGLNTPSTQVGQVVTLTILVEGAQNVEAPALEGLEDFDARYVGPSTQVSIVHGQMTSQVQHRYALTPRREGTFTLGPFAIEFGGQQYRTQPLQLTVAAAGAAPQAAVAGQDASGEQLRLVISVAKTEVYLHEVLPIDVTLYVGSVQVADVQYPTVSAEGISLDTFGRPRQFGQMIDGRRWDAVQFHANVIPLQAGNRLLGPAMMRLNVVERQRQGGGIFNDPFFNAFGSRRRPMEIHANPVALNVLPLPEEGKPADFSGAVGRFTMQVSVAPTELQAGDPVTLKIALQGDGNLADSRPPALVSTDGFKTYDAQVATSEGNTLRVFEQVLIPSDESVTGIPPVRFTYFDPEARKYDTIESAPIALAVRPAKPGQETRILEATGEQRVREQLGRDIVYIKDEIGTVRRRSAPWYGSWLLLLWWPIPPLSFVAVLAYDRRRQRLSGDLRYARFMQAKRNARRGLSAAEEAMKRAEPAAFYDELSRTLQTYLSDKLGLPPGAVDSAAIAASGMSADSTERLEHLFDICEQIRFAPTSSDGDMRGALTQAREIISRLEVECTAVPVTGGQP